MPAERTRAVILTTQRTGSTFLAACLDSHQEIFCAGELLNGQPDISLPAPRGPFRYVVKFGRIARTGAWMPPYRLEQFYAGGSETVRCFKAMYNQLARPLALHYLRAHREIRVIHLRRENLLARHISELLMQKRRELQATGPVAPLKLHVDAKRAIAAMRNATALQRQFEALFANHERLAVTYESLFDGSRLRAETARRICDFLGITERPMQSRIVKLNSRSLGSMIKNYDELAEALRLTEFAAMLPADSPGKPQPQGLPAGI